MSKHLPENLESPSRQTGFVPPRLGTSLSDRLGETLEIFGELRGRYALYSDFLPENVAAKQVKLERALNDKIAARRLFVPGERIEIAGEVSTVRPTSDSDFYSIVKNLADRAFFEGRFTSARVVPLPKWQHYEAMGSTKQEYAEWTSNRYGLTFMFDQMVAVFPSDEYPLSPDGIEIFPRAYTLVPVEYPGIDLRSADIAREEVMELFNGMNRADWAYRDDLAAPVDRIDEGIGGI